MFAARVQKLLADRKVTLALTDAARTWLGRVGYDPVYGARPLKRYIQKYTFRHWQIVHPNYYQLIIHCLLFRSIFHKYHKFL